MRKSSDLETRFLLMLRAYGLPEPLCEVVYAPPRRFRADFAYPAPVSLLIEVEGGVWGGGKHGTGRGVEIDCDKSRHAALHGWRVYRVTRKSMDEKPGELMEMLKAIVMGLPPHGRGPMEGS